MMRFSYRLAMTLLLPLSLPSAVLADAKKPPAKPVAIVNDEPISRADFDAAASGVPELANLAADSPRRQALERELVNLLVEEVLLRQFLRKNAPPPPVDAIKKRVKELALGLKARGRSMEDYCQETKQSPAQIEAGIITALQWNLYLDQHLTESLLRQTFETNRDYFEGVLLRASHIFVPAPGGRNAQADAAIVQQLQAVRRQLLEGLDFNEAVKRYSQDPATLGSGGDVGLFRPYHDSKNPFLTAAVRLQVGQISEVVRTDTGFHLIKLTDRRPGKPTKFEDAKHDVTLHLADELRRDIIAQQRKNAKVEVHLP